MNIIAVSKPFIDSTEVVKPYHLPLGILFSILTTRSDPLFAASQLGVLPFTSVISMFS